MFLIACAVVIVLAWAYIFFIRPRLAARWPKTWQIFDDVEGWLFRHSRQILMSRLYFVGGVVVAAHDALAQAGMDWTPLLSQIGEYVPEKYRWLAIPVALALTGYLYEKLRKMTTEPLI